MRIVAKGYNEPVANVASFDEAGGQRGNGNVGVSIGRERQDDAAILEISQEGKKALGLKDRDSFEDAIVQVDSHAGSLPEYSGMFDVDKALATAIENCTKEEQEFVYDIVRKNFLVENAGSMTEDERRANIALGMKKAEYAAENFVPEDQREAFLDAMESIAKLASAGRRDDGGSMDYGVAKRHYLGHGSNLVYTDDGIDMMRTMDPAAYDEYQRISRQGGADRHVSALRYLTNWYQDAASRNPGMVDKYREQSRQYVDDNVKDQKISDAFDGIRTESRSSFLESLRSFQRNNPSFLSDVLALELSSKFWNG